MAIKTFTTGEVLTASDTNTYLANSGLVYVTSTTVGSGVSSVTVSNVFSSTYDNYRIIYYGGSASAANNLKVQLGPSSVSGYNANYYSYVNYTLYNGTSSNNVAGVSNGSDWPYMGYHDTDSVRFSADLLNPNNAEWTSIINAPYLAPLSAGYCIGTHQNNGQYTAITFTPGSGTLTGGTITVYGYRKP